MNSKQAVLITGSSTGFGRLFTETLARKGHTVFATMRDPGGRNAKNAAEIRTLAEKDSLPIHVLEMDVTEDASVERAVDAVIAKAGRIDVAINNAGYYLSGLEEAVTTEQARRNVEQLKRSLIRRLERLGLQVTVHSHVSLAIQTASGIFSREIRHIVSRTDRWVP
jgi:NAD(P)-dependent dehydrogenase (short-subunit alcohol dehydrogenase family)